ncbi:type II toxin-antitoxin system PemI/MazE family antitoxin [Aerococcaceae bacterium WGS1372]
MLVVGTSNARKQRNAVVITIPAKFKIKAGQKFYIVKDDDDTIRLIPETEDFFGQLEGGQGLEERIEKFIG